MQPGTAAKTRTGEPESSADTLPVDELGLVSHIFNTFGFNQESQVVAHNVSGGSFLM